MRLAAIGSRRGVDAEDRDGAGIGLQQAGDHAEDGGLAGAVGAEQGVELAGPHLEVEVVDDRAVEALVEAGNIEGELRAWVMAASGEPAGDYRAAVEAG